MSTINLNIARQIVEQGKYASDKPAKVGRYRNIFTGNWSYFVIDERQYRANPNYYEQHGAGSDFTTLWTKAAGRTAAPWLPEGGIEA